MRLIRIGLLGASIAAAAPVDGGPVRSPATPTIVVEAPASGLWAVRYAAAAPMSALIFARSPDRSRATDWKAPTGFEITNDPRGELVRRRDGAAFTTVTLQVPPVYRDLPKDYAPFSPFGDGGMLFHSGRFFACASRCPEDARWRMSVRATGRSALVDGRQWRGAASWRDGGNGRSIYVGGARPVETPDLLAVIDRALPPTVSAQLDRDLPRFMSFYAMRLGAPPMRPMLFVSYDAAHRSG